MPRIQPVIASHADAKTGMLMNAVQQTMGTVPNMIATMAHSLPVTQAYLSFSQILAGGQLPTPMREQISLAVSEANQCDYCVAAHSFLGENAGLSEQELLDARHGTAYEDRTHAALTFARKIVQDRGHVSDEDLAEVRNAGFDDGEIAEIVANVALNIFTNYFNRVAEPEIDFPAVHSLETAQ
jgi:uncharacterized peroxidase-related enzyme